MTDCPDHHPVPCDGGSICLVCQVFTPTPGRELKPSYRTPTAAGDCPVCSAPLITANAGHDLFCPLCHAEGREPLVARMPPPERGRAVRGSREAQGAGSAGGNKYGAVRTEVDGIVFHSRAEARRYEALKLLESAGEIAGLSLQPSFDLIVNGCLVCRYRADFEYTAAGARVIEDVKGRVTAGHVIKRKLMLAVHGIKILETK